MPIVGNKIETTNDNFGDRVRKKHILVDKTLMIKDFWEGQDVSLITRPRRFGKTLNLSMLQHFFAAEVNEISTQGLFDEFAIATISDKENGLYIKKYQGQYPVIFISFKDTKEGSYTACIRNITVLIQELYREHKHLLLRSNKKFDKDDEENFNKYLNGAINEQELAGSLVYLSKFLYKAYGKKAIILIDEYDAPLTKAYEHKFLDKLSDFLRNMLSAALKGNGYLEKGLMTGILRVSKNSMLSGLNNLKIYTLLNEQYKQYFGFTEDEVNELIKQVGIKNNLEEIRKFYNGYLIDNTVIYNPWSLMNYLDEKKLIPYWTLTSNDNLLKNVLLSSSDEAKKQLGDLIQGKSIESEIDINLLYEDLVEKPQAFWTLLLFCGYLKVEKKEQKGSRFLCQLKIPNHEILQQYKEIFNDWLKEKIGAKYDPFLKSLVEGKIEEFTKSLTLYLFACTSSHDFQAESDYHSFVLGLLAGIGETHFLHSNKEYGAGRPDCLLIPKDKTKTRGIVLEFKHLHLKQESDRREVEILKKASHKSAEEALEQINMRGYSYAFSSYPQITTVLKIGIAFSNRIVSTACTERKILNGEEIKVSNNNNNDVTIFDADETNTIQKNLFITKKKLSKKRSLEQSLDLDELLEEEPLQQKKQKKETNIEVDSGITSQNMQGQSQTNSSKFFKTKLQKDQEEIKNNDEELPKQSLEQAKNEDANFSDQEHQELEEGFSEGERSSSSRENKQ